MNITLINLDYLGRNEWVRDAGLDPDVVEAMFDAADEQLPVTVLCQAVENDTAESSYYDIRLSTGELIDAIQGVHLQGIDQYMKAYREVKVTVHEGTTGPKHDPYGTTTVVAVVNGHTVKHYCDGLGSISVTVNGDVVFSSCRGDDVAVLDCAAHLFEQTATISLADAKAKWEMLDTGEDRMPSWAY